MAADFGAPDFKKPDKNSFQISFIYENDERDLKNKTSEMTLTDGTISVPYDGVLRLETTNLRYFMGRFDVLINDKLKLNFDLGSASEKDNDDKGYVVGLGLQFSPYRKGDFIFSIPVNFHYTSGIGAEGYIQDNNGYVLYFDGKTKAYEFNAGVIAGGDIKLSNSFGLMPYCGLYYTYMGYNADFDVNSFNTDQRVWPVNVWGDITVKDESKDNIDALLGLAFTIEDYITIRAEGRLIAEQSYSASVGLRF